MKKWGRESPDPRPLAPSGTEISSPKNKRYKAARRPPRMEAKKVGCRCHYIVFFRATSAADLADEKFWDTQTTSILFFMAK